MKYLYALLYVCALVATAYLGYQHGYDTAGDRDAGAEWKRDSATIQERADCETRLQVMRMGEWNFNHPNYHPRKHRAK